jgi:hypothetical protein
MHKKYAKDGLVAISVSVDPTVDGLTPGLKDEVLKFLRAKGATFSNLIFDESMEVLNQRLRIDFVPCLYVFNREGRWRQFIGDGLKKDEQGHYHEVEGLVKKLLSQK